VSTLVHSPKIDDFGEYLFAIVHGINYAAESNIVETTELALFISAHFLVTNHNMPLHSIESIKRLVIEDGRPMKRGADFLAYTLIDALVDNVMPTIDEMALRAEEIEEEVIQNPHQSTLEAILQFKRSVSRLHRVMAPQREVLNRLSRGEFRVVREQAQIFYRDIYDHVVRIEDLNQSLRDRADNAMSMYLSSLANRQNETMRVLSVVATIFLPLTLLAGIYGMNFDNMPELRVSWAYFAVLGFMAAVVLTVVYFFWAKRWFGWGRRKVIRIRPLTAEPQRLMHYVGELGRLTKKYIEYDE
jgi:magnesium transporter